VRPVGEKKEKGKVPRNCRGDGLKPGSWGQNHRFVWGRGGGLPDQSKRGGKSRRSTCNWKVLHPGFGTCSKKGKLGSRLWASVEREDDVAHIPALPLIYG